MCISNSMYNTGINLNLFTFFFAGLDLDSIRRRLCF
jgi:hypothetical protein